MFSIAGMLIALGRFKACAKLFDSVVTIVNDSAWDILQLDLSLAEEAVLGPTRFAIGDRQG